MPDAVGQRQQGDEERLVVGGDAGVGKRGDINRPKPAGALRPDALARGRDAHPHVAELLDDHVHVVGAGALDDDLTAGRAHCSKKRARLDAIGNNGVFDGVQLVDALDLDGRRPRADHLRAHAIEE